MPELPEVQTIVNDLQTISGDTITGFWTGFPKAIRTEDFAKDIVGRKIAAVKRIGKNVVMELSGKKAIVIHLKMTGKLILTRNRKPSGDKDKHLHHIFHLKKSGSLEFHDMRKFATLEVVSDEKLSQMLENKGIDPLSPSFTAAELKRILGRKNNRILKSVLMDQTVLSGIGNIYASEIPFDAKISPLKVAGSLSEKEVRELHSSTLKILREAIRLRGTSFSDYHDASGKKGGFQNHLKVYGKAGEKCSACGTIIEKVIIGQRSTFHCPRCQK